MNEINKKFDSMVKCVVLKILLLRCSRKKKLCLKIKNIFFILLIKLMLFEILFYIYMFCDFKLCEWNFWFLKWSCFFL